VGDQTLKLCQGGAQTKEPSVGKKLSRKAWPRDRIKNGTLGNKDILLGDGREVVVKSGNFERVEDLACYNPIERPLGVHRSDSLGMTAAISKPNREKGQRPR